MSVVAITGRTASCQPYRSRNSMSPVEPRAGATEPRTACLTSWSPPSPPPGTVRVPHLLSIRHGGHITDSVVWEVLTPSAARRWLGCELRACDLSFVESHLHQLVRLRVGARSGDLPPTAAAARLLSWLGPDRDLPISLVYQRADLFRALLAAR